MIHIVVQGTQIYGTTDVPITSGTVGRKVKFIFDSKWDNLVKTAVFKCGDESRDVYLGLSNDCELPWEILSDENVGKMITIGVYGMREDDIVYPTIYTNIDKLVQGTTLANEPPVEHTPELIEQLIQVAGRAEKVAMYPPIIGDNGNWWCLDINKGVYADSGYPVGDAGATFTPHVSEDGTLYWTNDKNFTNPTPVNIKGDPGYTPERGVDYWTPEDKVEIQDYIDESVAEIKDDVELAEKDIKQMSDFMRNTNLINLKFRQDGSSVVSERIKFTSPVSSNVEDFGCDLAVIMYYSNGNKFGAFDGLRNVQQMPLIKEMAYIELRISINQGHPNAPDELTPEFVSQNFKYWDNIPYDSEVNKRVDQHEQRLVIMEPRVNDLEDDVKLAEKDIKSLNEKANKLTAELAEFWLSSTFNVQGKKILNVPEIQFIAPNGKDGEVYLRMNKNGSKWLELINLYGGLDIMTTGEVRFTTPSGYADDVRLRGVATPTGSKDATNKQYVDEQIEKATKEVSISSVKADSDLDMKNRQILNLAEILFARAGGTAYFRMNPRGNKDMELINQEGGLYISTLGDVSFYGKNRADGLTQLHFIAPPSADTDAVNKQYVDNQIGDIDTALDAIIAIQNELIGG